MQASAGKVEKSIWGECLDSEEKLLQLLDVDEFESKFSAAVSSTAKTPTAKDDESREVSFPFIFFFPSRAFAVGGVIFLCVAAVGRVRMERLLMG